MYVRRYIEFVLEHRFLVLTLCLVVTAVAGWNITRGYFATSMVKMYFGESRIYDHYRDLANRFSDGDMVVVAWEAPELFSPDGWAQLGRIQASIQDLEFVRRVESIQTASRIRGGESGLDVASYADVVAKSGDYQALRREVLADDLVTGVLIAADGCCATVLIELTADDNRPVEELPRMFDAIHAAFTAAGISQGRLHTAGVAADRVEVTQQSIYNIVTILPIAILLLVLIVYLIFGQFWPVYIATGVALVSITWTFGFAILLDKQINIMMAMVPAVMLVVAFSDVIHLCSSYILDLRAHGDKREAILTTGSEVGQACFYTSATTFVGFIALTFVPAPVFRATGVILAVGVAIALLLAMTVVPIAFTLLPAPPVVPKDGQARWARWSEQITGLCLRVSTRWPKLMVVLFAAATAAAAAGINRIEIETSMVDRLDTDHKLQVDRRFITEHFDGATFVDVYLSFAPDQILEAATWEKIEHLHRQIGEFQGVDRVTSLVDLVDIIHRELAPAARHQQRKSRRLLSQYLLLFEMSGGEGLERLVDPERETMRMTLRLSGSGMVGAFEIGQRAERLAKKTFGQDVTPFAGGLMALLGGCVDEVLEGQKRGLGFALLATTIMMILCLRLFGAGLLSMIPNVIPIIVLGGYCGWVWRVVDSETMLIAMIAIGIAVDDTVHFMTRFRIESTRTDDIDVALERTFEFTGGAIVKTTMILCGGFLPFATSDYFTTQIMGTLLPMTLLVALVADLLLLPALVKLGVLRMRLARGSQARPQRRAS